MQRASTRWQLRLAIAGVFATVCLGLAPSSAFGHAYFQASNPAPGKRLEQSPRRVTLEFTEALNQALSKATIVDVSTGKAVDARVVPSPSQELIVKPAAPLPTAAYRVDWFSVSTEDGHALAGQFSFGVRTQAVGGARSVEEAPLARGGWWRSVLRAVFYAALFLFAGGVLGAALLAGGERPASWLVPPGRLSAELVARGQAPEAIGARAWRRTVDAGWLAAAGAAAVALADAANAAGGLGPRAVNDYLLANAAGIARVATVASLVVAAVAAKRSPRLAALGCVAAFVAIAFSGHANSADPRALALLTDSVHLVAAAIWIGGIAQLALTWTGALIRHGQALRQLVMRDVLARFGRVALPTFLVVLATGVVNALIELGRPAQLWESSYGRVLAVKIGLVALVALVSYVHAMRLRPRLANANPHPDPKLERRHWSLLRREPLIGLAVLAAAALLAAFPLPPRQAAGLTARGSLAACSPYCPLPAARDDQLAVADHLGPSIVAAWLQRTPRGVGGRVRLLGKNMAAVSASLEIAGTRTRGCGPGCWDFRLDDRPSSLELRAAVDGHVYTASLPAGWLAGGKSTQRARRLLAEAQETMNGLRSVREYERITSGPGSLAVTRYRLRAPDHFAYRTDLGSAVVVIGEREWRRGSADGTWSRGRFGAGLPFQTKTWFRWTPYAETVRLLGIERRGGDRFADVALYDRATPAWWRLRIDLASKRATASRLIAEQHFMSQRYFGFNRSVMIAPPPRSQNEG